MLDETLTGCTSTSAPSTPSIVFRRKPPPKPPRYRSIFEPLGGNQGALSYHQCNTSPPITSATRIQSLKSSLADVTNTLDRSVARSDPSGSLVMKPNPMAMKNKVFNVLMQLKDFLVQEINPIAIVDFLRQHGVINIQTEHELKRCKTSDAMCEMLLDIVTSKGREEFDILCMSLRVVERHDYLADLLFVVDRLIEIGAHYPSRKPPGSTDLTSKGQMSNGESHAMMNGDLSVARVHEMCPECATNNNDVEILNECSSFDLDISYMDIQTGEIVPNETIKHLKRRSSVRHAPHTRNRLSSVDSYLLKTDRDNPDRYLPVLTLSLYNQCLYGKGIETLAHILERYPSIRELSMAKNHIDLEGMDRIGRALFRNRGLHKLDIRLNAISDQAARCLAEGLKRNTSLRTLNVTSTGLTGTGCAILLDGLIRNISLVELDVGFNDIQDEGCIAISKLLASNSNLRKLRMRNNSIMDKGCSVLFRSLRRNARLSVLDLSSNSCKGESMAALAEMLLHNRTLKELNLEKCGVPKSGCVSLARALKTNTVLKSLDLSINRIGDFGCEALADGLKYNQVIDTMCLNMCGITNLGFLKILEALRHNVTMTTVKLCYNDIGHGCPRRPVTRSNSHIAFLPNDVSPDTSQDMMAPLLELDHEEIPEVDEIYEKLALTLQYNKNLKVLLWGNKLQDPNTF